MFVSYVYNFRKKDSKSNFALVFRMQINAFGHGKTPVRRRANLPGHIGNEGLRVAILYSYGNQSF